MIFEHDFIPSHRKLLGLLACALLTSLTACKKQEEAPAAAPAPAAPPVAAAPAAAAPPKEEPPVEFKAKWTVGQRLVQRIETITDTDGQNPLTQQPLKLSNTQVQEIAFTTLKDRDGGAGQEVEVETLALASTNRFGTNATVFNSRSDPKQDARSNFLAVPLRKLIGGKVKYLTTADGKVEKVEGSVQLRSKVAAGANMYALATLNQMLSDEAIKGWNTFHTGLPDKPVKPGDSWAVSRSQSFGPGSISMDGTNTFKGWEQHSGRKMAVVESSGTITTKPGTAAAGVSVTVEEGAKSSGKAWFDPELGVIAESSFTSEFSIKMTSAKGQATTSKVKLTALAKLADIPAASTAAAPPATDMPAADPAKKTTPATKAP